MRKSILTGALAGAAAALSGSPAAAQAIGDVRTVAQLGTCMYISHRSTALELLNASTAAQSDHALVRLKDEKSCFDRLDPESSIGTDVAAFSKGLMRGMIAEAALRGSTTASALQPLPLQQKRYIRPWFVATGRDSAVDEMSACVADTDPAGIVALVATVPNSSQESWAIGDLSPWLGKCLARGAELHADRIALRAALADALYQRVRDPALSLAPAPKPESVK
jgi:hypothetical protein